jgi:hypothetical protein
MLSGRSFVVWQDVVIGCFATDSWKADPSPYGNGRCFIFELTPHFEKFAISPAYEGSIFQVRQEGPAACKRARRSGLRARRRKMDDGLQVTKVGQIETYLAMGGGSDGYGLWVDGSLSKGRSVKCDAFNNRPLSGGDFEIRAIELYAIKALDDHEIASNLRASTIQQAAG